MNSPFHIAAGGALAAGRAWMTTRRLPLDYLVTATSLHCFCCFPMFISLQVSLCYQPALSSFLESDLSASPWLMVLRLLKRDLTQFHQLESSNITFKKGKAFFDLHFLKEELLNNLTLSQKVKGRLDEVR